MAIEAGIRQGFFFRRLKVGVPVMFYSAYLCDQEDGDAGERVSEYRNEDSRFHFRMSLSAVIAFVSLPSIVKIFP
jgi:hypothetical protein